MWIIQQPQNFLIKSEWKIFFPCQLPIASRQVLRVHSWYPSIYTISQNSRAWLWPGFLPKISSKIRSFSLVWDSDLCFYFSFISSKAAVFSSNHPSTSTPRHPHVYTLCPSSAVKLFIQSFRPLLKKSHYFFKFRPQFLRNPPSA